jgi:Uncharacterized protein conserved in bacteria
MSGTLQPYLFFSGRCEEALEYYRQALGAEIEGLIRFKDSPEPPPPGTLQSGFEDKVMHASLRIGEARLMASDGCDDGTQLSGFKLSLALPSEADARRAFEALADGGQVEMPLSKTFWSSCFGMLTDRFGVGWMVSIAEEPAA